jgi:hypothetical protein
MIVYVEYTIQVHGLKITGSMDALEAFRVHLEKFVRMEASKFLPGRYDYDSDIEVDIERHAGSEVT